jgi:hypothetical protein
MALRLITSTSAAARLDAVAQVLRSHPPATEILIVSASRGAADDLVRQVARRFGATEAQRTPVTQAGAEAAAMRAAFDAILAHELDYFGPVARLPGFSRALARTLHELRLAGVGSGQLAAGRTAGADLARLLDRVDEQFAKSAVIDRAMLFTVAASACEASTPATR